LALTISAESSSKGDISGSILDPLQYEENDMDPVALVKSVCSMFPNVSTDFIDELLKANEFDIHLTIDMLDDLNSQYMFHDDAELGFPTFAGTNDHHEGQVHNTFSRAFQLHQLIYVLHFVWGK
jgi:hypothetical protein